MRVGTLNVGTVTGMSNELADMMREGRQIVYAANQEEGKQCWEH